MGKGYVIEYLNTARVEKRVILINSPGEQKGINVGLAYL